MDKNETQLFTITLRNAKHYIYLFTTYLCIVNSKMDG